MDDEELTQIMRRATGNHPGGYVDIRRVLGLPPYELDTSTLFEWLKRDSRLLAKFLLLYG